MPLILCLTVVASVGIGVLAAYTAVIVILNAFGGSRSRCLVPRKTRPRLVLVPTHRHASGD